MQDDADDALLRFDQLRTELAFCDQSLQAVDLKAHTGGHGAPLSPAVIATAGDVLRDLAETAEKFAKAATRLADALTN